MKIVKSLLISGIVVAVLCAARWPATAEEKSPVGRTVADFTLKDYRGKTHSLSDHKKSKVVVIAFLGTDCPLAKLYGHRLGELQREYGPKGVAFLGINANSHEGITAVAAHARQHRIDFPVLKDLGNKVADAMGAVRTPEVFVLDEKCTIRYWGRVDDQYGVSHTRTEPKSHDLKNAIDQLLAGKPVATPVTKAEGCFIARVLTPNPDSPVTYTKHIAPIMVKNCVECHRPGEIAPFSLTNYSEVVGWAETIREVVDENRMPPWHADPKHGKFKNERRLSDDEKKLIATWVKNGAPKGNPKDMPAMPKFLTGWQLPQKPDIVINMADKEFTVSAEGDFNRGGNQRGLRYRHFIVDPGFKEDKWVKMAEIIPGNRAVVHHILVAVKTPGRGRLLGAGGGEFLAGYVPGLRARILPDGYAKLIPAGSKLVFQLHYTPIGSEQKDLSKIGLVFADEKDVKKVVITTRAANPRFAIPPGDANYKVEATSGSLPFEIEMLSLMPHMHLRGKSFSYEAWYPDGRKEMLLDVPRYDFNWQTQYNLAKPKTLPAKTRVHCVAHFDNSEHNLNNPDPTRRVTWGDQTWDEMMIGYFDITVDATKFNAFRKLRKR